MPINLDAPTYHVGSVAQAPDSIMVADDIVVGRRVRQTYGPTQTKSANYTMTAADSGYVTKVDTDAITITLPATVIGYDYVIENAGADGTVLVKIAPNAADKIQGIGLTAADNKALQNTKATAKKGDFVHLKADGTDGWFITEISGTWAREA